MSEVRSELDVYSPVTPFPGILEHLSEIMSQFDSLNARHEDLVTQRDAAKRLLEEIDLDLPPVEQPDSIANAALRSYVFGQRAKPVEAELRALEHSHDWHNFLAFMGKRVVVTLAPDQTDTRLSNVPDGNRHALERGVVGKISRLSLNPVSGGYINVDRRFSGEMIHIAPLVARDRGYQPLFDVVVR